MGKFILNWLSERLDLAPACKLLGENLRKPVPTHVNWLFTLGASIACLLGLQLFSGLLLMVHYKPSAREAYTSIEYIMDHVTLGWFVRGLHSWGAHLIMILLLLHMIRVFVYGGYKRPRELTWVIGVLLFAVVAGFGFTGYLLPWDQMAYWATVVATEAPATIPIAGPLIREFMVGGVEVADGTIGRFYVLHVIVLPLALVGLVGLHLFLIRCQGVSSLQRTDLPEPTPRELGAAGGKPFWPYHLLKDLTSCYIIIGVLVTLALLFPPHLGDPANPFLTPIGIKPEWYFLPAYQLLKYVPEAVGVQAPPLFLFLLLLLPFVIDRSPERHPRRRLWVITGGLLVFGLVILLGVLGHLSETKRTILGTTYQFDIRGFPESTEVDSSKEQP